MWSVTYSTDKGFWKMRRFRFKFLAYLFARLMERAEVRRKDLLMHVKYDKQWIKWYR